MRDNVRLLLDDCSSCRKSDFERRRLLGRDGECVCERGRLMTRGREREWECEVAYRLTPLFRQAAAIQLLVTGRTCSAHVRSAHVSDVTLLLTGLLVTFLYNGITHGPFINLSLVQGLKIISRWEQILFLYYRIPYKYPVTRYFRISISEYWDIVTGSHMFDTATSLSTISNS